MVRIIFMEQEVKGGTLRYEVETDSPAFKEILEGLTSKAQKKAKLKTVGYTDDQIKKMEEHL